ncbi:MULTISPECIES: hypothetical protein [Desulfobacula]|uniref:Conserved uncharacterized protein n=2 Tax=Desulfobacula TaxID=28222 RepID=K0NMG4_DESTT|nr:MULTISPECIES: hypothetical protein [Desulfobacula]CCK81875.1 conserved uncharacterized protein [Desulfobacula toluolica Tol2]SDT86857.1 hypothetical protein SAMN04487931_102239 [Desulfobacula phenolica]
MCNHCSDHSHTHQTYPEIVQIMPVQTKLYAVYKTIKPLEFSVQTGKANICLVPVLFMALIRQGEKTMVEGFFAFASISSCEDVEGFKGYASSLEDAEKLYA